jgi:GNAT superfamily N-acetyltransferase
MDHFRIRPAEPADLETLVAFSAAMALETEGRTLDQARLREGTRAVLDASENGVYWVAEPDTGPAAIVGQLLITYEWSDWRNATFWWIQSVYVRPDWRRRGVYRALHRFISDRARERGNICGIRLYVESHNTVAQTAYTHVGLRQAAYTVFEEDFVLPRRSIADSKEVP